MNHFHQAVPSTLTYQPEVLNPKGQWSPLSHALFYRRRQKLRSTNLAKCSYWSTYVQCMHGSGFGTTNGENRLLVTDEPVEVQDSRKTTDHFRGICRVFLKLLKKSQKITTCNQLDLETLGFCPIMPKEPSRMPSFGIRLFPFQRTMSESPIWMLVNPRRLSACPWKRNSILRKHFCISLQLTCVLQNSREDMMICAVLAWFRN